MPQIVPSAGFSPSYSDYTAFTTDFDLSLLPESPECQVPLSPCAPYLSLEDGLFDNFGFFPLKSGDEIKTEPLDEPLHTPLKKALSSGFFSDMDTIKIQIKKEEPLIPTTVPTSCNIRIKEEEPDAEVPSDHQLLRSVLKDTSFQRKYNIHPLELPALDGMAEKQQDMGDLEPVLNLPFQELQQQLYRVVDNTCSVLGIAKDLIQWTEEDVKAWLLYTARQFGLPPPNTECFNMDGSALSQLTEEDFLTRSPQCGSQLHAHLEIWKAASGDPPTDFGTQWSPPVMSSGSSSAGDFSEDEDEEMDVSASTSSQADSPQDGSSTIKEQVAGPSKRTSGAHIHLWQFLKELLSQPQQHGTCIRWLDRQNGVFKIEDSVRVARLWGKRKNRPAMNYDKLSRSIRQYYKKGIMKKTERSQRLVYQFCRPYSF